jgi:hypothetical protein
MSKENSGPFVAPETPDAYTLDLDIYLPTYIWLEGSRETLQVDLLNAAAPKLYEALKVMVEAFEHSAECDSVDAKDFDEYKQAMAALTAARGEVV